MQVRPKKHLGQHFLTDKNTALKIVEALQEEESKNLIEIGPGKGVLSELIEATKTWNTKYIELDKESVTYLTEVLGFDEEKVLFADVLKLNFNDLFTNSFSIIGNLPYNVSSPIFFRVLENKDKVDQVVCMIQKEVAERIAAKPGSKTYGILSVLLQAYYDIEFLFSVSPGVFYPPPKVWSAVIRLKRNDVKQLNCNEKLFFQVVKAGFNQRRKTLRNSLKAFMNDQIKDKEIFSKRPEQLFVSDFVDIVNFISAQD